jgi:hypothetical protein
VRRPTIPNRTVNQALNSGDQIAPGFELLAQALIRTHEGLPSLGLADEDLTDAQAAADDALAESSSPNRAAASCAAG